MHKSGSVGTKLLRDYQIRYHIPMERRENQSTYELPSNLAIREAQPDDAEQLAILYKETWRATYPNDEYGITRQDIEEKTKNWGNQEDVQIRREKIQNSKEYVFNIVADIDGCIIGNSVFIRKPEGECNKLATMYVHPEYHGMGVGAAFAKEGLQWLGSGKPIALEVAKYNRRAIEFYRKFGFEIAGDGESPVADLPSGATIPEYLMVKDVPDS